MFVLMFKPTLFSQFLVNKEWRYIYIYIYIAIKNSWCFKIDISENTSNKSQQLLWIRKLQSHVNLRPVLLIVRPGSTDCSKCSWYLEWYVTMDGSDIISFLSFRSILLNWGKNIFFLNQETPACISSTKFEKKGPTPSCFAPAKGSFSGVFFFIKSEVGRWLTAWSTYPIYNFLHLFTVTLRVKIASHRVQCSTPNGPVSACSTRKQMPSRI